MINQSDLDQIRDQAAAAMDRKNAYEAKERIANIRNREERQKLVDLINEVLAQPKYGITERIDASHIEFRADYIGNVGTITDKKLTEIIYNFYFPIPQQQTYYHFTSLAAAQNIMASQQLRLHNLNKRFNDDEFVVFYREHGMDGYDTGGTTFGVAYDNRSIMNTSFFLSLASMPLPHMWHDFGDNGRGVRLGFNIHTSHPDFRDVYYSSPLANAKADLVKELENKIREEWQLPFVFSNISKAGAFYIKGCFSNEYETRFLIKTTSDNYNAWELESTAVTVDAEDQIRYITLPLQSSFADFNLVSIQLGYACSESDEATIQESVAQYSPSTKVLPKAQESTSLFGGY